MVIGAKRFVRGGGQREPAEAPTAAAHTAAGGLR